MRRFNFHLNALILHNKFGESFPAYIYSNLKAKDQE